jgi:hypothetical protein
MSLRDLDKSEKQASTPVLATDILARMRMGKQTVSEIRMGEQVIPVRVLSASEVNAIRHAARAEVAKTHGDETDENLYIQRVTLQLASQIDPNRVPFLTDKIMQHLSIDEMSYLYSELIKFWEQFNPSLEQITPEKFRLLVDALKKNRISWSDCSMPERKAIFICFVDMIQRDTQTSQQGS